VHTRHSDEQRGKYNLVLDILDRCQLVVEVGVGAG